MNDQVQLFQLFVYYILQFFQLYIGLCRKFGKGLFCLFGGRCIPGSGRIIHTGNFIIEADGEVEYILAAFCLGLVQGFFHSRQLLIDGVHLLLQFMWNRFSNPSTQVGQLLTDIFDTLQAFHYGREFIPDR